MENTLYEYYKSKGQALPSVQSRTGDAAKAGITGAYTGTAAQNNQLLNYLKTQSNATANVVPPPPTNPPAGTVIPPAPTYKPGVYTGMTAEEQSQMDIFNNLRDQAGLTANTPVDESAIRARKLQEMQAEIDAVNNIYAEKIKSAQREGQGRLGSGKAIQARSGLLGSDFGAAQTEEVLGYNRDIEKSISDEMMSKIAAIKSLARKSADEEIEKKTEAKRQGADDYIKYLSQVGTVRKSNTDKLIKTLLAQGISPDDMSPEELSKVAKDLGVSKNDLTAMYKDAKFAKETSDKKTTLENEKDQATVDKLKGEIAAGKWMSIGDGAMLYNPATGETVENPENYAPSTSGVGDLSSKQYTALTQITTKFQADPIINQSVKGGTASMIADQIIANPKAATNQLKALYVLVKNLDPDSAVREGEMALANQTQSYLQQFGNTLARITDGRVVSPDAAVQLATATKELMSAWNATAQKRQTQYNSQANVLGVGDNFNEYITGSQLGYGQQPGGGERKTINGVEYEKVDGGWKKVSFNQVGGDTNKATGMRTDRHNNPTAFTTDIAKTAGLVEGRDYVKGDSFDNGRYYTAKLTGDPIATTIKVIDKIGFYTGSGKPRWTHTAMSDSQWQKLSPSQKANVIKEMYRKEGGSTLAAAFNNYG